MLNIGDISVGPRQYIGKTRTPYSPVDMCACIVACTVVQAVVHSEP